MADKRDPNVTAISSDPADYLSGPTGSQTSRTQGGTTKDGQVRVVGGPVNDDDDTAAPAGPGTDLAQ